LHANNLSEGAANIGINMSRASPVIGDQLARLLFGDINTLSGVYILRFYWLHVFILPLVAIGLMVLHMGLVWLQGVAEPHRGVHGDRASQGGEPRGPAGIPATVWAAAGGPPAWHPAVPARGDTGPRHDLLAHRDHVLPFRLRDAVPRTRSKSSVVGTHRPRLVPPVLMGPSQSRGHLPPVHAG